MTSIGVGRVEMLGRGRWHPPPPARRATRIVAVGSTGGRVGKSTVSAHLAVAMAQLGAQVTAVDLDLRSPSLHQLFGVERPSLGLRALLDDEIQNLDSSLFRTSIRNLHLVTGGAPRGGGRALGLGAISGDQRQILIRQIRALESDIIVLDLGAGTHDELLDFFTLTDTRLLVTSPQLSSLASSFGFLMHAARRTAAPAVTIGSSLVGNLAASPEEVEIFHAFSRLVRASLAIDLPVVGCARADGLLAESTRASRGPIGGGDLSENGRAFRLMAESLLHDDAPPPAEAAAPDAPDVPLTEAVLASRLGQYRRKHLRVDVDWAATLRLEGREVAVRVVDISHSGAALEVASELLLHESATLLFDQLPGRPALPVVVKSLSESLRRAGVAFSGPAGPRAQVLAAAAAQRGTRA